MTLQEITRSAINPALAMLPPGQDSPEARVMLLAIGLQESRFEYRRQLGRGPARGYWQFELGTEKSRGGVWGVYLHKASGELLRQLCEARAVTFHPTDVYRAIEYDDVLAAGVARLLLLTDPYKLPAVTDRDGAWDLYALRCWRPGKPHRKTWDAFHQMARIFVAHSNA